MQEKEEQFHPLRIYCPGCKRAATILDVMFSIKGSVRFKLVCVLCGNEMTMHTSWDRIICYCAENETISSATVFEGTKTLQ